MLVNCSHWSSRVASLMKSAIQYPISDKTQCLQCCGFKWEIEKYTVFTLNLCIIPRVSEGTQVPHRQKTKPPSHLLCYTK